MKRSPKRQGISRIAAILARAITALLGTAALYKEYFNNLKNVEIGMEITLHDKQKQAYHYTVAESKIVDPDAVWVLDDFGDDRITIITCTDDGTQRQVVVGLLD